MKSMRFEDFGLGFAPVKGSSLEEVFMSPARTIRSLEEGLEQLQAIRLMYFASSYDWQMR
ncbi:hypothetical protein TYRP_002801 [Tyrophagus putrescentiae]|nr:hypothetical protein TYRP_002801 [Tyrophagus putrescentiae]